MTLRFSVFVNATLHGQTTNPSERDHLLRSALSLGTPSMTIEKEK